MSPACVQSCFKKKTTMPRSTYKRRGGGKRKRFKSQDAEIQTLLAPPPSNKKMPPGTSAQANKASAGWRVSKVE
jgi:hypothetical protein